jgi:hypothetical protein
LPRPATRPDIRQIRLGEVGFGRRRGPPKTGMTATGRPVDLAARRGEIAAGARYARVPAVASHAKLRAETYRVLIALGIHADRDGRCWPSRWRIAQESCVAQRNLGRNFRDLIAAGLLAINTDGSYRIIFQHSPVPEQHSPVPEQHSPVPEQHSPVPEKRTTHRTTQQLRALGKPRGRRVNPNDELFDRFIGAYPSRGQHANPRKPARAKFTELVRRGIDPEKLIEAAAGYAAAAADLDDRRYVAQAITWLRQGRYDDYAASAPVSLAARAAKGGRSDEQWREILRAYKASGARWSSWPAGCGLPPQKGNASRVPEAIRMEFGFD